MFLFNEEIKQVPTWVPGQRRGLKGVWYKAGFEKCLSVSGHSFIFGFASKDKSVKSDASSYRKPADGEYQLGSTWGG